MGDLPSPLRTLPPSPMKKRFSHDALSSLSLRSRSNSTRSPMPHSCAVPLRVCNTHDTVFGRPGPGERRARGSEFMAPPPRPPARDPHVLLYKISRCLNGAELEDGLEFESVLAMKQQDLREVSNRIQPDACGRAPLPPEQDHRRVFGTSLREIVHYAAYSAQLGGYLHDLPIVAFTATEELYRTGLYKEGLFVDLPNRDRHVQLMSVFDHAETSFGRDFDLHTQPTPDICALLTSFITLLPEPLFHPLLLNALWTWCVEPTIKRDAEQLQRDLADETGATTRRARHQATQSSPQDLWKRSYRPSSSQGSPVENEGLLDALEAPQISIAQLLFRLLPAASFSLFAYLCAFFSQVTQYKENGMQSTDIARIFAHKFIGGDKERARQTMVWLLDRWTRLAAEILADALEAREKAELEEAASSGPTPRPLSIKTTSESTTTSSSSSSMSGCVSSPSSSTFPADQVTGSSPTLSRKFSPASPTDSIFNMDTFAWDASTGIAPSLAEIDTGSNVDLSEALHRILLLENEGKEGASANLALQRDLEVAHAERDEAREMLGHLKKMMGRAT